jgi:hypothetical protein
VHHIALRSEGGLDAADNLIVLCAAHHAAVHRGTLHLEGSPSRGLVFRHADKTPYGSALSPSLAGASAQTFGALRQLGFSEKIARSALDQALSGTRTYVRTEAPLRAALAFIPPSIMSH